MIVKTIIQAIDQEEKVPYGNLDQRAQRLSSTVVINVESGKVNEDMYSVLTDKTIGDAWLRARVVDMGEGITAYVKVYKWFMGTSGMGLS